MKDIGEPEYKAGDRVFVCPTKMPATVINQVRHFDGPEQFWGNLNVTYDDGSTDVCHCWQAKRLYRFQDYVYEGPYIPFYDAYKGQEFIIDHYMKEDERKEHVWLTCVSEPSIIVNGYLHFYDLIPINKE